MITIRLKPKGKKKQPSFRIIISDSRKSRDSNKFLKDVGYYNTITKEVKLDKENIIKWLKNGAKPTDTVKNILKKNLN